MEANAPSKSTEIIDVESQKEKELEIGDAPGVEEETDDTEGEGLASVAWQGPGHSDHLGLLRALLHVLLGPRLLGVGGRTVRSLSTNILLGLFDWESLRHGFPLLGPLCRKGSAAG